MPRSAETVIRTGCKLNLYLAITGIRNDGYHTIESLMYPLREPFDVLRCAPLEVPGRLLLRCPGRPDLEGTTNILHKAWTLLSKHVGPLPGVSVELEKRVPEGAGLGGGSANAAGFLKYLLDLPGVPPVSEDELLKIAAETGADVPFFLKNVPAFAGGIGERLQPSDISLAGLGLLLVFPKVRVSTAWAYAAWDRADFQNEDGNSLEKIPFRSFHRPQSLTSRHPADIPPPVHDALFYNSFEDVVFSEFPCLRRIKETLWKAGAAAALMSGSGSCIFGLFEDERIGKEAAEMMRRQGIKTSFQRL